MCPACVLVVHPPVSVARDFIDYPYLANLGAVQLVAALETGLKDTGNDPAPAVAYVDAFALPTSTLDFRGRDDGRGHLGASVEHVLAAIDRVTPAESVDFIALAFTPFHRPPHRDDILSALLQGLAARFGPDVPVVLTDAYQSGQHYIEAGSELLDAYPEADAYLKYEAEVSLPELVHAWRVDNVRPTGVLRGQQPPNLDELPF
ncbi:MAG: hypothetical protein ACPG4T_18575, partial [Nannocystaceae bacterium]